MSKFWNISQAAAIALHAMVLLAKARGSRVSNEQIALALHVSEAHLSKVLQRLAKAGLVQAGRGPKGGFSLARDPADITLLEVYEVIEGPLKHATCLFGQPICGKNECILRGVLKRVNTQLGEYLARTTIRDLAEKNGPEIEPKV